MPLKREAHWIASGHLHGRSHLLQKEMVEVWHNLHQVYSMVVPLFFLGGYVDNIVSELLVRKLYSVVSEFRTLKSQMQLRKSECWVLSLYFFLSSWRTSFLSLQIYVIVMHSSNGMLSNVFLVEKLKKIGNNVPWKLYFIKGQLHIFKISKLEFDMRRWKWWPESIIIFLLTEHYPKTWLWVCDKPHRC